jgi:5-formyltetrahydrofolate cyclo-ligase
MNKKELRERYRDLRQEDFAARTSETRETDTRRLCEQIVPLVQIGDKIAGYVALWEEIDPKPCLDKLSASGHLVALPYFIGRTEPMEFRERNGPLEPGPFGIKQPAADNTSLRPDVLLIPLLAADLAGNRLGQGQGHYDRAISVLRRDSRIVTIGLAWECQIADPLPADPWDEPLNYIATPDRLIETNP